MKRGISGYSFLIVLLVVVILSIYFALALSNASTALTFARNTTSIYDKEGNFTVNWTAPVAGDSPKNYSIYISIDGGTNYYTKVWNDSAIGYTFSNSTNANYTFKIGTVNVTGNETNSSGVVSMMVDTVGPTITLPLYTNATSKKNTSQLTLNISITDASSGLSGSLCLIDINGTNESVSVSGGWCNSTVLNLTGLADGNQTIKVYVNDSATNLNLNNSFVVQTDTTVPTTSGVCSPSSVYIGDAFPCTCGGSDVTSGKSSSGGSSNSPDGTSTPSLSGTFTYTCEVIDNAGNSASSTTTYTVSQNSGGPSVSSGGGGSLPSTFWTKGTYSISEEQFKQGHSLNIVAKQRVKIKVSGEDHYVGVKELTSASAKIEVSSIPQEKVLLIGEEWKADITGDNYYDLIVKLNSIEGNVAGFTVKSINELIPQAPSSNEEPNEEVADSSTTTGITGEATNEGSGGSLLWFWILIALIVIAFVIWFIFRGKKHKK